MKLPSPTQWQYFFKNLSRKDKISLAVLGTTAVAAAAVFGFAVYYDNTETAAADNGIYVEGMVGAPVFLNPVYADLSAVDRDINELLFSGLLKYGAGNEIIGGLAGYKISEDGKTYEFTLKDGQKWSDGKPVTSDDAIYTVKVIQDLDYKSPLRAQWIGVKTEKVSDREFRFTLNEPNAAFLENCVVKIIPRHIWEKVPPENFAFSSYNLEPVVSGAFMVKKINRAKDGTVVSVDLARNPEYRNNAGHFSRITFMFFADYNALAAAFKRGQIQGFVLGDDVDIRQFPDARVVKYSLSRYFAVFLNPKRNKIFADPQVRQALAYATDKNEIISGPLRGFAKTVDSPLLAETYGIQPPDAVYDYDPTKANAILDKAGYAMGQDNMRVKAVNRTPAFQFTKNLRVGSSLTVDIKELQKCLAREVAPDLDANGNFGKGTEAAVKAFQEKYRREILDPQNIATPNGEVKQATREKLNEICFPSGNENIPLNLALTVANQEPFLTIAQIIKSRWEKIGVAVNIQAAEIGALERDIIKPRAYEALLFGEAFGAIPDPYPFWHSTQKEDPGLNFSLYESKDADKLLENIRKNMDLSGRNTSLDQLQNLIAKDAPLILLYNPDYIFIASADLQGATAKALAVPGQRLADIADWYTATKRAWKWK